MFRPSQRSRHQAVQSVQAVQSHSVSLDTGLLSFPEGIKTA